MMYDANYPDITIDGHTLRPDEKVLSRITAGNFQDILMTLNRLSDFSHVFINQKKRRVKTIRNKRRIIQDGKIKTVALIGEWSY